VERPKKGKKRKDMNYGENAQLKNESGNVIALFGNTNSLNSQVVLKDDPLETLLKEAMIKDEVEMVATAKPRKVVSADLLPEQSMYVLQEQLNQLKRSMNRIKFYVDELRDIVT
jgi:hypothetical protein